MNVNIETRRFDRPDDRLDMTEAGGIYIIKMIDGPSAVELILFAPPDHVH
jgi:hypothetical protein